VSLKRHGQKYHASRDKALILLAAQIRGCSPSLGRSTRHHQLPVPSAGIAHPTKKMLRLSVPKNAIVVDVEFYRSNSIGLGHESRCPL
jgi:hypothetical protein